MLVLLKRKHTHFYMIGTNKVDDKDISEVCNNVLIRH